MHSLSASLYLFLIPKMVGDTHLCLILEEDAPIVFCSKRRVLVVNTYTGPLETKSKNQSMLRNPAQFQSSMYKMSISSQENSGAMSRISGGEGDIFLKHPPLYTYFPRGGLVPCCSKHLLLASGASTECGTYSANCA